MSNAADVKIDLGGLRFLRGSACNKAIRIAMNKAMAPVKAAVTINAPRGRTGLLKSAQRIKIKYYGKTGQWVGMVGVSTKVQKSKTKQPRKKRRGKPKTRAGRVVRRVETVSRKAAKRGRKRVAGAVKVLGRTKPGKVVKRTYRKAKRLKNAVKGLFKKPEKFWRPGRYAHLIEWGHKGHQTHYLARSRAASKDRFASDVVGTLKAEIAKVK